jgi:hypothetical protein
MPIFHDKKIIFIRVPKTASKSMHLSLNEVVGYDAGGPIHEKISSMKDRIKESLYKDCFKFAFVRNPWDWFLSWISYKQTLPKHMADNFDFNKWVQEIEDIRLSRGGVYWKPGVEYSYYKEGDKPMGCSFGSCRAMVRGECICLVSDHQYHFICDKDKNIMVDFVGRFENIKEDWDYIASKMGVKTSLVHTNKSSHKHYRDVYTDKTAEIVYNLFKEDIDMFGYEF